MGECNGWDGKNVRVLWKKNLLMSPPKPKNWLNLQLIVFKLEDFFKKALKRLLLMKRTDYTNCLSRGPPTRPKPAQWLWIGKKPGRRSFF